MDNVLPFTKPTPSDFKHGDGSGGNGGGGDMTLDKRVGNLEKSVSEIEKTLIRIEMKLDTKATAVELAEIKGQIKNMPSTWQLIVTLLSCMLGVAGFVFAIVKYVK